MKKLVFLICVAACAPKDGGWADPSIVPAAEDMPLVVSSRLGDDELVSAALEEWNAAVGCPVLVGPVEDLPGVHVMVLRGEPWYRDGRRVDGETWIDRTTGIIRIRLNTPGTITWNYLILMHELGHALGLAHDRWRRSVMRPGGHLDEDKPPWPIITHQDRKLLRTRFCGGRR